MCHFFKVEIKTGALKNAIKKKGLERPKQEDQDTKRRIFLLFPPNACMHVQSLSHVRLFVTPWTIASKAPLTMGFSRQEYWSGLPCPPPGDLPDPGIKPASLCIGSWILLPLSQLRSLPHVLILSQGYAKITFESRRRL